MSYHFTKEMLHSIRAIRSDIVYKTLRSNKKMFSFKNPSSDYSFSTDFKFKKDLFIEKEKIVLPFNGFLSQKEIISHIRLLLLENKKFAVSKKNDSFFIFIF